MHTFCLYSAIAMLLSIIFLSSDELPSLGVYYLLTLFKWLCNGLTSVPSCLTILKAAKWYLEAVNQGQTIQ